MNPKRRYYDLFSPFYDGFVRLHSGDRQEGMRDFCAEVADVRDALTVVDLCTGTGASALRLARAGARVLGVDFSGGMLREARRKAVGHPGIQWIQADVRALPISSACADRVTCSYAMYELPGPVRHEALKEVARILRPGGKFVMIEHLPPKRWLVRLLYLVRIHVLGSKGVRSFAGSEEGELVRHFERVGTILSDGEKTKAVYGFTRVPAASEAASSPDPLRASHDRGVPPGGSP